MAQMEQSLNTAPEASPTLEAKHGRLQKLVGELLVTNQQLRFQVQQLEREKDVAERALASATVSGALLLP